MILGIDPGSKVTGYGILCTANKSSPCALDWGLIIPPATAPLNERIGLMAESVEALIKRHRPAVIAVESQFIHLNPQSALKLGLVRGAILFAAKKENVTSFEYSPALIKKRSSGSGRATKQQMIIFMASTLQIDPAQLTADSADALATAYCHWRQTTHSELFSAAQSLSASASSP